MLLLLLIFSIPFFKGNAQPAPFVRSLQFHVKSLIFKVPISSFFPFHSLHLSIMLCIFSWLRLYDFTWLKTLKVPRSRMHTHSLTANGFFFCKIRHVGRGRKWESAAYLTSKLVLKTFKFSISWWIFGKIFWWKLIQFHESNQGENLSWKPNHKFNAN